MDKQLLNTRLTLVQGDIVDQTDVDALVNAANSGLSGGGGVDGAIHRAAGPALLDACRAIFAERGRCPAGDAVITHAGEIPVKHVIHAVGPYWKGGMSGEFVALENAYVASLKLAREHGLRKVAFPSISTGAYRFPIDQAAMVALGTLVREIKAHPDAFDELRVVVFSASDLDTYQGAFEEVWETIV